MGNKMRNCTSLPPSLSLSANLMHFYFLFARLSALFLPLSLPACEKEEGTRGKRESKPFPGKRDTKQAATEALGNSTACRKFNTSILT